MLSLARRSVVQDRVDVLLKIGLGPMGKVGPTLTQLYYLSHLRVLGRPDPRQVHLRRATAAQREREESQRFSPGQKRAPGYEQPCLPEAARGDRAPVPLARVVRPIR